MAGARPLCAALLALGLAGCATGDGVVRDNVVHVDPWCEREFRAAQSQPVAAGASREEASALRNRHVSLACRRAYDESNSVRVPISGRNRIPPPVPVPPRRPQ